MVGEPGAAGSVGPARSKAELAERIRRAWASLDRAIGALSAEQITTPPPGGGWSVKDHLAHIAAWEREPVALLRGRPVSEALGVDEGTYAAADVDEINAVIYERNKDRPLPEVLSALRESHRDLLAAVEKLTDADLARRYAPDDPEDTRPLAVGIASNSYEHYLEHLEWIGALVERIGRRRRR